MRKIIKSLSYANVMATIAVFLTVGGAAFAVAQVPRNSVTGKSIRNNTITGRDVRNGSLTGLDINELTLTGVTPAGPAGGDLTGTFPDPQLGPAVVGKDEIAEGSVTGVKLGLSSVDSSKIQNGAVGSDDIAGGAVGVAELADDVIGGNAMKGMFTVTSPGIVVNAGSPKSTSAQCPAGRQMIGGGYSWLKDEPNSIIVNAPNETAPNSRWDVRGMVDAGSNTLFAWANCLLP